MKYSDQNFTSSSESLDRRSFLGAAAAGTRSDNAKLFARSGLRHPHRDGPPGVIEVGAYGDLLIAIGNPLEDLNLVARPNTGLALIMKGGKIYKSTLQTVY